MRFTKSSLLALLVALAMLRSLCVASIHEGIPSEIDPGRDYLFFLHGQIVEDRGIRPLSEAYGIYEYRNILETFENRGFGVISEPRAQGTDVWEYARVVASQVDVLLAAGVPAGRITIVGSSKGGAIAIAASSIIQNENLNYVVIAACSEQGIDLYAGRGAYLSGRVLSIYDVSDKFTGSCKEYFEKSLGKGLSEHKEVVLETGLGHGFHYRPSADWIDPAIEWALRTNPKDDEQQENSEIQRDDETPAQERTGFSQ
jgi:hypothetical protein